MTLLQRCTPIVLRIVIPRSHCYRTKFRDWGHAPIPPPYGYAAVHHMATSRGIRKQNNSQSEQTNERTKYSRPTINQRNVQKYSRGSSALDTVRIAPKICRGQPPRTFSECFRFYPNRFTFGVVIPERVNTGQSALESESNIRLKPIFETNKYRLQHGLQLIMRV